MDEIAPPAHLWVRLVARANELSFPIPPMALHLKLCETTKHWTLFVQPDAPGTTIGIAEWIEPFAPKRIEFGSRSVIRADFDPLPMAWATTFLGVTLESLHLDATGGALVTASGARAELEAFTRRVRDPSIHLDVRRVVVAPEGGRLLTARQDEALREAVARGYYEIPRPINLRGLAVRMSLSSASLSERLRRAEGRVITRYVYEGMKSPWDADTIFAPHALRLDEPAPDFSVPPGMLRFAPVARSGPIDVTTRPLSHD